MNSNQITIDWNVTEPTSDSSLHGLVKKDVDGAKYKFGNSRARVVSVRAAFNTLMNGKLGKVNKERKAAVPALSPVTEYDVIRALKTKNADSFALSFEPDMLYAWGRKTANIVGFDNHLNIDDIKDCLSFLTVDFVEQNEGKYITIDDLSPDMPHEADGMIETASELPAGASEIPADLLIGKAKAAKPAQAA